MIDPFAPIASIHQRHVGVLQNGGAVVVTLVTFNVGFTEVVPTVGGERGERELISNRYTVTTRTISALRWEAM